MSWTVNTDDLADILSCFYNALMIALHNNERAESAIAQGVGAVLQQMTSFSAEKGPSETVQEIVQRAVVQEREACIHICIEREEAFLSPQYATPQPMGSFSERFACRQIADAIRNRR